MSFPSDYLPILKPGYEAAPSSRSRKDCEDRFEAIRRDAGDFKGKTLLDFGCNNGFFSFRFLQNGGKVAVGIERDASVRDFANETADELELLFEALPDFSKATGFYDFCFYLDLHYHEGANYLRELGKMAKVIYVSPSGDGNFTSPSLEKEAREIFARVTPVYLGFNNRMIFRCENGR